MFRPFKELFQYSLDLVSVFLGSNVDCQVKFDFLHVITYRPAVTPEFPMERGPQLLLRSKKLRSGGTHGGSDLSHPEARRFPPLHFCESQSMALDLPTVARSRTLGT